MPTDRHSELETKFRADHVSVNAFRSWCVTADPIEYFSDHHSDVYYRRGEDVVRHRHTKGAGEITVKKRKNASSTTDRVEIDLTFSDRVTRDDVDAFLRATGWVPELTLFKDYSYVFLFHHGNATISVSLYGVSRSREGEPYSRFLEVEIEKGSDVTDSVAQSLLSVWSNTVAEEFDLAAPETESLYEMFTGRRYSTTPSTCTPTSASFLAAGLLSIRQHGKAK